MTAAVRIYDYDAYIAALRPDPRGGYIRHYAEGGLLMVSGDGMRDLRILAALAHRHHEALAVWTRAMGAIRCEHGIRLDSADFEWSANTYAFDPWTEPERGIFLLWGWHQPRPDSCAPWAYHVAGVFFPW